MRRNMIAIMALACATAASLAPSRADAASYYWRESAGAKATYMYRYSACFFNGSTYTFETTNLSSGADTVMHLVVGTSEVAYNDDYLVNPRSRIQYTFPGSVGCTTATVWVRAYGNSSGGDGGKTFEFVLNGFNYGVHRLGGWTLYDQPQLSTLQTIESVLLNDGAEATLLLRLQWDGTHYKFWAADQTSGVGVASKLWGTAAPGTQRWVWGTPTEPTREGPIRIVRNAATPDADQDGLIDPLEVEACTCATSTNATCPGSATATCATPANQDDTDSDGLTDKWELVGVDDASYPQLFPLWGANPRHRDVFVEVDRDKATTPMMTETQAKTAAGAYASLGLTNWDGVGGIALHYDIGQNCTQESGNVDFLTNVCGNFGGSTTPAAYTKDSCTDELLAYMNAPRRNKFFWILATEYGSGNSGVSRNCGHAKYSRTDAFPHELGHSLGLFHWGASASGAMNGKSNYRSIMNYSFKDPSYGFSNGLLPALNPRNMSETTDFGPGSADISHLSANWLYAIRPGFPRQVDWNRDDEWNPSVRAHVGGQPLTEAYGGGSPVAHASENVPSSRTLVGPGAAHLPAKSLVVVNDSVTHKFRFSETTSAFGGWTAWSDLANSPTFAAESEPVVATFLTLPLPKFIITGVEAGTNNIRYATRTASGSLSSWSTIAPPSGVVFRSVASAQLFGGSDIYLAAVDSAASGPSGQVWHGKLTPSGTWSSWTPVTVGGANVVSSDGVGQVPVAPALAAAPDGRLYMLVKGDVNPWIRNGDVDIYIFDPISLQWSQFPVSLWPDIGTAHPVDGRPGIVWRPHLDAAGSALSSGNGAFWIWAPVKGGRNFAYRWTNGKFTPSIQTFDGGWWHITQIDRDIAPTSCYRDPVDGDPTDTAFPPGGAVAMVDHPESAAVYFTQRGDAICPDNVFHAPYADGLSPIPTLLQDTDDKTVMAATICLALHAQELCKCTNFNNTCGYGSPEGGTPSEDCDYP